VLVHSRSIGPGLTFHLGWDVGIVGMKAGGERELTIPAPMAYGKRKMSDIPPNSTLKFGQSLFQHTSYGHCPDTSSDSRGQTPHYQLDRKRLSPERSETKSITSSVCYYPIILLDANCSRVMLGDGYDDRTHPPVMHSHVHLAVVFTFPTKSSNKVRLREDTRDAEEDYTKLLRLLESSGLKVVGKAGRRHGEIIVLIHSPWAKLDQLARLEQ
jgi:hypothetical protein